MIGGIVLAAGLSTRMAGELPKQLLPFRGEPLVATVVANAAASDLDRIVVVTGHRGAEVAEAVSGSRAVAVENPNFTEGNMTSYRAGWAALPRCEAYVVLLADMPGIKTEMIDRFVETWRRDKPWAAVGHYTDRRAHPLLLSAEAAGLAVTADGPRALWRLLEDADQGVIEDIVFDHDAPIDVNTVDEYGRLD